MERLKQLRAELEARFTSLSPRERLLVGAAAAAILIFFGSLIAAGMGAAVRAREARIVEKTKVMGQVGQLAGGYRRVQLERSALEARLKGQPVQLMSHVSQVGSGLGVEVTDLRPTGAPTELDGVMEESVEVNLVRIELGKLAKLVQGLERGAGLVKVRRLRIATRTDDPKLVDATVVVATYQLKG
jgi:general secretion pathway protein M